MASSPIDAPAILISPPAAPFGGSPSIRLSAAARRAAARLAAVPILAGAGPLAALVLASLLWGTSDVAGKLALSAIPPAMLAAMRFGIALVVLWVLARMQGAPRVPARITAPLGLIGVALTFLLQNLGLDRTSATNASLLQGAAPALVLLLAAVILRERLGLRRVAAVGAAMAGVVVVTVPGGGEIGVPGLGDLLVLGSAACFAAFVVLGRRAFPAYGTLPVLAGMAGWGTAALIPIAAVELWLTQPPAIGPGELAIVLYLGVGCSALTYGLWGYALRHVEAGRAGAFDTLIPVVGMVAAVAVLREAPLIWHGVGGAFVVAGVWTAVREPQVPAEAATNYPTKARFSYRHHALPHSVSDPGESVPAPGDRILARLADETLIRELGLRDTFIHGGSKPMIRR